MKAQKKTFCVLFQNYPTVLQLHSPSSNHVSVICLLTYKARVNGPSIDDTLVWSNTEDTRLGNSLIVSLNGWVDIAHCHSDGYQALLIKIIAQDMSYI